MKHLLSVEDLSRREVERVLDRAGSFAEVGKRDIKKVPTLRGRTVVNLFYESSTRTSSSFELAAKRLSADLVSIKAVGSAVDKGESLKDTIPTLSAYDPAIIVIRSPFAGAAGLSSFRAEYEVYLGQLSRLHPGAKFVLLSPAAIEGHPDVALYAKAIAEIAREKGAPCANYAIGV